MATEEHDEREHTKKSRPRPEGKRRSRPEPSGQQGRRPPQRRRRKRRRRRRTITPFALALSVVVLVLSLVSFAGALGKGSVPAQAAAGNEAGNGQQEQEAGQQESSKAPGTVSFCAVGDNLMNGEGDYTVDQLGLANKWAGGGQGKYDFNPMYDQMRDTISSYDIAFVNQETTFGGNDGLYYQGYPTYNTPDQVADALVDAGFDVVNYNSNHSYDTGAKSIERSQKVWAKKDKISLIGSYTSEDDRKNIRVVERNGIKIAFLSYCYGQNGQAQSELPNDYYAVPFDKDKMHDEITRAKEIADAVVVYMHWGEEYEHTPSEQQKEYARFLAGQGVDLTIGSHAHVIQEVEYVGRGIPTTDGSGANENNGMLCVYGLGDYLSGYTRPVCILSGMFTCDFVRDDHGQISVTNPVWHGVIEHSENNVDEAYLLKDYNDTLAKKNKLLARVGEDETYSTTDPLKWAKNTTKEVVGDVIPVEV